MKRILFLITTLGGGGAEKVLVDTANALSGKYDVTVMTISGGGTHEKRLEAKVKYKNIINCKNAFLHKTFFKLFAYILPPIVAHRLFIGNKYDYEVAFLEGIPTKIIAEAKTKKYAWVHCNLVKFFGLEKVHKNMQKHIECYKKYDKIICVSDDVKSAFAERFGITDNVEVKYNLLDDDAIVKKSLEPIERNGKFTIVSVGRLIMEKGFDRLLVVVKRLIDENIDCELVLVGEGSEYESLKKYADENGIPVEFTGFSDNPYKYMASADLLVFPSRTEGYSTVATEAVILGKPVVASDCSGMTEIFGNSEWGIVTHNDEELYNAVKAMICDDTLRNDYAQKARERAKDFSMESRLKKLEELF